MTGMRDRGVIAASPSLAEAQAGIVALDGRSGPVIDMRPRPVGIVAASG